METERSTRRSSSTGTKDRKKHEEMGFHDGWGKAFDQLVVMARKM